VHSSPIAKHAGIVETSVFSSGYTATNRPFFQYVFLLLKKRLLMNFKGNLITASDSMSEALRSAAWRFKSGKDQT
jgi:hypothetical protein